MNNSQLVTLNQNQVINVIKIFYGDPSAQDTDQSGKPDKGADSKSSKKTAGLNDDSYADHYNRVKELSAIKKWNEIKFNKMLGDRKAFNREWRAVSDG